MFLLICRRNNDKTAHKIQQIVSFITFLEILVLSKCKDIFIAYFFIYSDFYQKNSTCNLLSLSMQSICLIAYNVDKKTII